jgi:hypothetical protein
MEEEWTRVTPRRSCSNRGYCVEILGREGFVYIEGEMRLHPDDSEPLATGGFAVRMSSIIGDTDRRREILDRIRAGLESMGSSLQVDDDET